MKTEYKSFVTKRAYGVELEISNNLNLKQLSDIIKSSGTKCGVNTTNSWATTNTGNELWHVKRDSTCGPKGKTKDINLYGYEIASYVASGKEGLIDVSNVTCQLKTRGAIVNKNCGLHVHADARDLDYKSMAKIIAQWVRIEPIMLHAVPPSRRNNKYCKTLSSRFRGMTDRNLTHRDIWTLARPRNLEVHDNPEKKYAINTVGFAAAQESYYTNKNTVELRLPEGTLERENVKNWVRLWINFVSRNKKVTLPENLNQVNLHKVLNILGLQGDEDTFYILSRGLYETKVWFLKRICTYTNEGPVYQEAKKILLNIV